MNMTTSKTRALYNRILARHQAHYNGSPTGLVDPSVSPNSNLIYRLYATGEISCQKGGWAYNQRSEFMTHGRLSYYRKLGFEFPHTNATNTHSYVVLTEAECIAYREEMIALLLSLP